MIECVDQTKPENLPYDVRNQVFGLMLTMMGLNDDQRLAVFSVLLEVYCQHCGAHTEGNVCHCTNDQ